MILVKHSVFMYWKFAKRVDLKCSHHRKELVMVGRKSKLVLPSQSDCNM